MTPVEIVTIVVAAAIVAGGIAVPLIRKKKGTSKSCCGGKCGCAECSHAGLCHNRKEEKEGR